MKRHVGLTGGRAFTKEAAGAAALEFAIVAPVFCLLLAGAIDYGGALFTKFALDGAVSAAGNYSLLNAASVGSTGGASLATSLAGIVASGHAANWANATIIVNNGSSASLTGGVVTLGGTAANADSCYCPTRGASGPNWGAAASCGSTCDNGSLAGKYVSIFASHTYRPVFPSFGLFATGTITAGAVVATQ